MPFFQLMRRERSAHALARRMGYYCLAILIASSSWTNAAAQSSGETRANLAENSGLEASFTSQRERRVSRDDMVATDLDSAQGWSVDEIVHRALVSNAELMAARLDIDRARARLRQAGLRPNPTIDLEQQNGVFNTPGEHATSVGLSLPLELGGKRRKRIDLAQAELEVAEAEIADRERRLANEVRAAYVETMAALRELEVMTELDDLDARVVRVVEARVAEGDAAPIELNLLRVELERLRSRRALIVGRLQAGLLRLQNMAGMPLDQQLRIRGGLPNAPLFEPPATVESALEIALRTRPDLRRAQLEVETAEAGLKLTQAQSVPQVTVFTRYGVQRSSFDSTPIGAINDRDKLFTFGVSIGLPIFDRKQGTNAEAEIMIVQAKHRRQFIESAVRAEVMSAWARHEAAKSSLKTFECEVLARSNENVGVIRGAFEIGAFRITEVINVQRRLLDSQREFTEALVERYRALADLQAAMGEIEKR